MSRLKPVLRMSLGGHGMISLRGADASYNGVFNIVLSSYKSNSPLRKRDPSWSSPIGDQRRGLHVVRNMCEQSAM